MTTTTDWWKEEASFFLDETLAFINYSRTRNEAIECCEDLCKALNKTWNAFYKYRCRIGKLNETERIKNKGQRTDTQSFQELLTNGLNDLQSSRFCESGAMRSFVEISPLVMDHKVLVDKNYDPSNITEDIRNKASSCHQKLLDNFKQYSQLPSDFSLRDCPERSPLFSAIIELSSRFGLQSIQRVLNASDADHRLA